MSSSEPDLDPRATDVWTEDGRLVVALADGRWVAVPLTWFPRLLRATAAQRRTWRLLGGGAGIHWPEIDEDVRVDGLLRGAGTGRTMHRTA